jgi:hypothetical protein
VAKRGEEIPRPNPWTVRAADRRAGEGWDQLLIQSPDAADRAWVAMTSEPRRTADRQHQLKGGLAQANVHGTKLDQWQLEVTGALGSFTQSTTTPGRSGSPKPGPAIRRRPTRDAENRGSRPTRRSRRQNLLHPCCSLGNRPNLVPIVTVQRARVVAEQVGNLFDSSSGVARSLRSLLLLTSAAKNAEYRSTRSRANWRLTHRFASASGPWSLSTDRSMRPSAFVFFEDRSPSPLL